MLNVEGTKIDMHIGLLLLLIAKAEKTKAFRKREKHRTKKNVKILVCHVLRYTPFFTKINDNKMIIITKKNKLLIINNTKNSRRNKCY